MYLKTLTLRGFKSFASATTFEFEPGVTCVVGPNGSGKSNVVDALAWVMGEQGAKTLRGGKMEDVIFAGTVGRAPLGRAHVALTIDNTDGALPIEYAEVTISRTMFRNGGSEYAINGTSCRLLDVQELLSDSGLGRQMHVIVGQGQLDAVLRATPEDRRGFIEEAAGVLKHRRRKEKALRKLESMAANLTRLQDLTAELRRQLGPLARQADVARRAARFQSDLRDAKARLMADDLAQITAKIAQEQADEATLKALYLATETSLSKAQATLSVVETSVQRAVPALEAASETWYRLSSLRERVRGLQTLAHERIRLLSAVEAPARGQNPEELEAHAEQLRAAESELAEEVARAQATLESAIVARTDIEAQSEATEARDAALLRAAADRREGLARLEGLVTAKQHRVEALTAECERIEDELAKARTRAKDAAGSSAALEVQVADIEAGEIGLDAGYEAAREQLNQAQESAQHLAEATERAATDCATWNAKIETLELALNRKDGPGALLAAESKSLDVLGSLAESLAIVPGYEGAVAAVLGTNADAVTVSTLHAATQAIQWLRDEDAGQAPLVIAQQASVRPPLVPLPEITYPWLREFVAAPEMLHGVVERLVHGVAVVQNLAEARQLLADYPEVTAVTVDGDVLGGCFARGGSAGKPSALHLQSALEQARTEFLTAQTQTAVLTDQREQVQILLAAARSTHDEALARLHESDATMAAATEQLGRVAAASRVAEQEIMKLSASFEQSQAMRDTQSAELAGLNQRLADAHSDPQESQDELDASGVERARLAASAVIARAAETEARLALRTKEERMRALAERARGLERAAQRETAIRQQEQAKALATQEQLEHAHEAVTIAGMVNESLERSLAQADGERAEAHRERKVLDEQLVTARAEVGAWRSKLAQLNDATHRDELARAQQMGRLEQLQARVFEELGVQAEDLVEEYGPHRGIPVVVEADADATGPDEDAGSDSVEHAPKMIAYVRAEQEKRLKKAERAIALLGRVNPLALEEFSALEERHTFLAEQLDDLKRSRLDLLQIVKEIDDRVEQVFAAAFADTQIQFERVFPRLFPGGEGRLVLTDPRDLLTTGIEIEARPAGKKIRRLSLLSGGERSLTAVALLVSIFKARPSPFYVMDEVEAALDDVNLGRLLEIFRELRDDSQLIVITHQKRTMEIADALYGVTMRGDGVTTVISQRLRESE